MKSSRGGNPWWDPEWQEENPQSLEAHILVQKPVEISRSHIQLPRLRSTLARKWQRPRWWRTQKKLWNQKYKTGVYPLWTPHFLNRLNVTLFYSNYSHHKLHNARLPITNRSHLLYKVSCFWQVSLLLWRSYKLLTCCKCDLGVVASITKETNIHRVLPKAGSRVSCPTLSPSPSAPPPAHAR